MTIGDRADTVFAARTDADGLAAIPADRYSPADGDGTLDQKRPRLRAPRRRLDVPAARRGRLRVGRLGHLGRRVGRAAAARDALHRPRRVPPGRDGGARGDLPPAAAAGDRDAGGAHAHAARERRRGRGHLRGEGEARRLRRGRGATSRCRRPRTSARRASRRSSDGEKRRTACSAHGAARGVQGRPSSRSRVERGSAVVRPRRPRARSTCTATTSSARRWLARRCTRHVTRARTSFTPPGAGRLRRRRRRVRAATWRTARPRAGPFQTGDGALDANGAFAARRSLALRGAARDGGRDARGRGRGRVAADDRRRARARSCTRAQFYVAIAAAEGVVRRQGRRGARRGRGDRARGQARRGRARCTSISCAARGATVRRVDAASRRGTGTRSPSTRRWPRATSSRRRDVAACHLVAPRAGLLPRARAREGRARQRRSRRATTLYVHRRRRRRGLGGERRDGGRARAGQEELRGRRPARVLVKSPFNEADALVTVERSGIYRAAAGARSPAPTPTLSVPDHRRPAPQRVRLGAPRARAHARRRRRRGADVGAPASGSATRRSREPGGAPAQGGA